MEILTFNHFSQQIEQHRISNPTKHTPPDKFHYILLTEQSQDTIRMDTLSYNPVDELPELEVTGMSGILPICKEIK